MTSTSASVPPFRSEPKAIPRSWDYLRIERDGDTLKVGRRNRNGFNWGDKSAKIYVTMPRIVAGAVAGSGDMTNRPGRG